MPNIVFVLDGDAARRLIRRKIGKHPTPTEIELFCRSARRTEETVVECYYYDCAPFGEIRPLPISGADRDFSAEVVYSVATKFQERMLDNSFFKFKKGYLSFNGWNIKDSVIVDLMRCPRVLTDDDFVPHLSQKQVDMKIGLDIAKISLAKSVERILLITCDSDFIPIVDFAQSNGVEVDLILDTKSIIKGALKNKCGHLRYV